MRGQRNSGWTAAARFATVLAMAAMSEAERSTWWRAQGLLPSDLDEWQEAMIGALEHPAAGSATLDAKAERKRLRELERALRRKGKALGGATALLVLSKSRGDLPQGRERMIGLEDRRRLVRDIRVTRRAGTRQQPACAVVGIDAVMWSASQCPDYAARGGWLADPSPSRCSRRLIDPPSARGGRGPNVSQPDSKHHLLMQAVIPGRVPTLFKSCYDHDWSAFYRCVKCGSPRTSASCPECFINPAGETQ